MGRRRAERIVAACVESHRRRALSVEGGEVVEVDGLVVALTNLSAAELNAVAVAREPADPPAALEAAEEEFRRRGHPFFGIELERDRYPAVEEALSGAGLVRLESRPAVALALNGPALPVAPAGVQIVPAEDDVALAELRMIETAVFGTEPAIAERFIGPRLLEREDCAVFLARFDGDPVGQAVAWLLDATVGVFGVGVTGEARRRGIGSALTQHAAHAFGERADLAWLQPTEMARSLYARLGFRRASTWDVWIRSA